MKTSRAEWTIQDMAALFGEQTLIPAGEWVVQGVSTDTRTLEPGNLFVALRGERLDAHTLLGQAWERGASAAMVEVSAGELYSPFIGKLPLIVIENTMQGLGTLAHFHRCRYPDTPIIAVAGSAGKTSTKELIAHILATKFNVLKTEGNLNNQIGTPLTLLRLSQEHQVAVIEIGTNEPGEIAILSEMVAPTHGIITNIGKEHLERLVDLDGVEREETTLFSYLFAHHGVAFVNYDDKRLRDYLRSSSCVSYSLMNNADVTGQVQLNAHAEPCLKIFSGEKHFEAQLQTVGMASAVNALAAGAVALALDLAPEEIVQGLEVSRPATHHGYGRMVAETIRGVLVLNDCYNANPASMNAALDTLASIQKGRKIALLADMLELGNASLQEHRTLLQRCAHDDTLALVIVTGREMEAAIKDMEGNGEQVQVLFCPTKEECLMALNDALAEGDILLVKGSRSMRLEDVIHAFR